MKKEKFSLKDHLFNAEKVTLLSRQIFAVYPNFNKLAFSKDVLNRFPQLELKERISWIAQCLNNYLPKKYPDAIKIILNALPEPCDPSLVDDDFGDFIYAPYSDFVATYGCNSEFYDLSLNAIKEITTRFSAEYALRPFFIQFPEKTIQRMLDFSKDSHYHVRRLSCEGSRPNLPWGKKINISEIKMLPILDNLFKDKTRFVTRSVANHLNDISKLNPDLTVQVLKKWKKSKLQSQAEMDFIIKHSLRSLIKVGHADSLKLLGVDNNVKLEIDKFKFPNKIALNTQAELSFNLSSKVDANVMIDYIIYYQSKSGKLDRQKIFKLKSINIKAGESIVVAKKIKFAEDLSTRTIYRGNQAIEIQINGKKYNKKEFMII